MRSYAPLGKGPDPGGIIYYVDHADDQEVVWFTTDKGWADGYELHKTITSPVT